MAARDYETSPVSDSLDLQGIVRGGAGRNCQGLRSTVAKQNEEEWR